MATMGKLDATSMAVIGKQLRLMYAEIIAEGVPERFAEILRRRDNEALGNAGWGKILSNNVDQ